MGLRRFKNFEVSYRNNIQILKFKKGAQIEDEEEQLQRHAIECAEIELELLHDLLQLSAKFRTRTTKYNQAFCPFLEKKINK